MRLAQRVDEGQPGAGGVADDGRRIEVAGEGSAWVELEAGGRIKPGGALASGAGDGLLSDRNLDVADRAAGIDASIGQGHGGVDSAGIGEDAPALDLHARSGVY